MKDKNYGVYAKKANATSRCVLAGHPNRMNPQSRAMAFSFQLHDMAQQLYASSVAKNEKMADSVIGSIITLATILKKPGHLTSDLTVKNDVPGMDQLLRKRV